jgi:hypothetical protein
VLRSARQRGQQRRSQQHGTRRGQLRGSLAVAVAVADVPEPATQYLGWAQNRMVPSKELRGSPVVNYVPQLVKIHAVATDEGEASEVTVCGRHGSRALNSENARPFDQYPPRIVCHWCAQALDVPFM